MPENRVFFGGIRCENANKISSVPYTIWNFIPLQLVEAFSKPSNFFFLIVAILQQIPAASPTGKRTAGIPLIIFVTIEILINGMRMWKQKKRDDLQNEKEVIIWNLNGWESTQNKHLSCGNIIKVGNGEAFPADCIALYASNQHCNFHLNTYALDGETMPKCKLVLFPNSLPDITFGFYECCSGQDDSWRINDGDTLATKSNLAERGCILKNDPTEYLVALVIRTGEECTIRQNIGKLHSKPAKTDDEILRGIFFFSVSLIGLFVILCSIFSLAPNAFKRHFFVYSLFPRKNSLWFRLISFFIMFSTCIPLSVYYLLELIRKAQSFFIENDLELWTKGANPRAPIVNSGSLNSELGTLSTIVVDKTGTITQNLMRFHSLTCCLSNAERQLFIDAICTCHSISLFKDSNGKICMSNYLIDEYAILKEFLGEIESCLGNAIRLKNGRNFEILHTQEFVSEERKSSVIVAFDGEIFLFVKGSDSVMLEKVSYFDPEFAHELDAKSLTFGLRSLVYCGRKLSQQEFISWKSRNIISTSCLETKMSLLGAVFLIDKLQPKVKDTTKALKDVGINIAMASGDKREVCIGTAKLIGMLSAEEIHEFEPGKSFNSTALTLNGSILETVNESNKQMLIKALSNCLPYGVIAYRMKPGSKRKFIQILNEIAPEESIAAVGDGANDIGMLQEATIGIGIYGKESNDSVLFSQYAVGTFSHLERLILHHGSLNRERANVFIIACFYKSFIFCFCHVILQLISWFGSFAPFYHVIYGFHNVFWTIFAGLTVGILDQNPCANRLYSNPRRRIEKFKHHFWCAACEALWHSICITMIPYYFMCKGSLNFLSMHESSNLFSAIAYTCMIIVVNGKILFVESHFICWINFFSFLLSLFVWICYLCIWESSRESIAVFSSESFFLILIIISACLVWSLVSTCLIRLKDKQD